MTVEEYIEAKVLPEYRGMVTTLRTLMREVAPHATELISYGVIMWRGKRGMWIINATKNGLTVSFSKGASFEDPYHLLEGAGKVAKTIWLKRPEDINQEAMRYYMREALKLDEA